MKLKSVSVHGFKSFADRTQVVFHDGITGVIGPNGSGKSNVIDAVRWVMGEQTAKNLRAEDPTDIIFAGSQNRKPLSLAEVVLTFTNTGESCPPEYLHLPEISIGRRIFRSGEREYFMNRQPCRLKDIMDFLGTVGLGSKSYSIIQQERRDRIIQAKPDDLREILEEAAGISIFKQRRKEAEQRLESTSTQLKSLADVEGELLNQSESLKEQVTKAEEKKRLMSEIRETGIELIRMHVGIFRSLKNSLLTEINKHSIATEQNIVESVQWEEDANQLKSKQLELTQLIKEKDDLFYETKAILVRYQERSLNQDQTQKDRVLQKEKLSKELQEENATLARDEEAILKALEELQHAEEELKIIDGKAEGLDARLEEEEEILTVEKIRGEELKSEIQANISLISNLRTKNQNLLENIQKLNMNIIKNQDLIATGRSKKTQLQADYDSLNQQLQELSLETQNAAQEKIQFDSELQEVRMHLEDAKSHRDVRKQELLEVTTHLQSLQKIQNTNLGLSTGAKSLKERFSHLLKGMLYEKIEAHPADERYLELALPHLLESALVQDPDTLIDLLDKAEEQNFGRVHFVVQDLIQELSADELLLKQQLCGRSGFRNVGDRLKSVSDKRLKSLFDRVFIVRDEWGMLSAFHETHSRFIFVSERGTVVQGLGDIGFGQEGEEQAQGILHRKREIAELEQSRNRIQEDLAALEGNVFTWTERSKHLEDRLKVAEDKLSQERYETLKLSATLEQIQINLRHVQENVTRIEQEQKQFEDEIDEQRSLYSQNQTLVDKHEYEKNNLQIELSEFEVNFSEKTEHRNELKGQRDRLYQDRVRIVERQSMFRVRYDELSQHVQRLRLKVDKTITQIAEYDSLIAQSYDSVQTLAAAIQDTEYRLQILEEEISDSRQNEAEVTEQLKVLDNRIKKQRDIKEAQQKFLSEKRNELARIEIILETAEKEAKEKYELELHELPDHAEDDQSLKSRLETKLKKLNIQIQELGSVNELALEEYQQVEERRTFLSQQKEDCLKSMQNLQDMISEIEHSTKTRFMETYTTVNTEFQGLFPILFPGGHAELKLLNPDDLLTTGVEIMVQLPGKKQQNMNLFSGGEKALTAISLIFALLKTKPAPFCFLDEVDAPLDEANVERFNKVLESLCHQFQFVVITHNRRTMEVLDTIYGISMTEPGISKLVSVDLSAVPEGLRKKSSSVTPQRAGASAQA